MGELGDILMKILISDCYFNHFNMVQWWIILLKRTVYPNPQNPLPSSLLNCDWAYQSEYIKAVYFSNFHNFLWHHATAMQFSALIKNIY